MHLPGRLSSSTLGDLFGSLHRERITGTIELSEINGPRACGVPGRSHRVHLHGGLVVAVETAIPVLPIGEVLQREGLASREVVRQLVSRIQAGDRRVAGEILASAGLASAAAVRAALRAQLRDRVEALFALFSAGDARVLFRTARPLPEAMRGAPLDPREFLHGRPRSRDGRGARPVDPPRPATLVEDPADRARRLLGLSRGAAVGDVRRAFRRLAGALHPDRFDGAAAADRERQAARFAELSAAYHLLVA
jgi:hypothetical protein